LTHQAKLLARSTAEGPPPCGYLLLVLVPLSLKFFIRFENPLHRFSLAISKMIYTLTVHLYANEQPDSISRIKAKLIEASRVYRKDKETVDWIVMQDVHDPRAFTIVERFENEGVSFLKCSQFALNHLLNVRIVAKIPPRKSILEDLRSICCPAP